MTARSCSSFFDSSSKTRATRSRVASSGEEGFAKTKVQRPDLILLDLIMPGMDGLEFLTHLRSDLAPPIPPAILCSGFELTEEEALRRGALMFVRKPVAPADLCEFVALGLLGERVSAETAARERANSAAARLRTRKTAATFVARIRREVEQKATGQMAWLAAYFGVETALTSLMEDGRLTVFAAAGDAAFTTGLDLADRLPPCHEILESCSSLVLADASVHACFSTGSYRLEGVRFFAGVPLLAPEGIPIGVVCLLDSHARRTHAEDLAILEQVGRQGSLLLKLLALGRPESELPGRLGAGMMLRPSLELLVDAELRLLRQRTGSMELAVVEMDDPEQMREAVLQARDRERLGARRFGTNARGSLQAQCRLRRRGCDSHAPVQLRRNRTIARRGHRWHHRRRTTAGSHWSGSHPIGRARARTGTANGWRRAAVGAPARSVEQRGIAATKHAALCSPVFLVTLTRSRLLARNKLQRVGVTTRSVRLPDRDNWTLNRRWDLWGANCPRRARQKSDRVSLRRLRRRSGASSRRANEQSSFFFSRGSRACSRGSLKVFPWLTYLRIWRSFSRRRSTGCLRSLSCPRTGSTSATAPHPACQIATDSQPTELRSVRARALPARRRSSSDE